MLLLLVRSLQGLALLALTLELCPGGIFSPVALCLALMNDKISKQKGKGNKHIQFLFLKTSIVNVTSLICHSLVCWAVSLGLSMTEGCLRNSNQANFLSQSCCYT